MKIFGLLEIENEDSARLMSIGLKSMKQKTLNSFFAPKGTSALTKPSAALSQTAASLSPVSKAIGAQQELSSPAKRHKCIDKENAKT